MIVSRKQEKDIHLENLLSSRTMNSLLMPSIAFSGHDLCCIRGERMVFAHLSFSLHPGDALVLLGANGSGKSSLLRLMAGLLPPAYGTLRWHDAKTTEEIRPHYVGHAEALKPMLTVAENLGFWTRIGGAPSDAIELDALPDRSSPGQDAGHVLGQHLRGQHLQLHRHGQTIFGTPGADAQEDLTREEHFSRSPAPGWPTTTRRR